MGKSYFNFDSQQVNTNMNEEDLKNAIKELCDEDYSGNNGEDYFVEDVNGNLVSKFDLCWNKCKEQGLSVEETIDKIINDNYSSDSYYENYGVNITRIGDEIVISVAYMYYN